MKFQINHLGSNLYILKTADSPKAFEIRESNAWSDLLARTTWVGQVNFLTPSYDDTCSVVIPIARSTDLPFNLIRLILTGAQD